MVTEQTATEAMLVGSIPFEEVARKLDPFISTLVRKSTINFPKEDLQQEMLITVWNIYQKYNNRPFVEFSRIAKSSCYNRITDIHRSLNRAKNPPLVFRPTIGETDRNTLNHEMPLTKTERDRLSHNGIHIDAEKIAELKNKCSKQTAKIINMVLTNQKAVRYMSKEINAAMVEIRGFA